MAKRLAIGAETDRAPDPFAVLRPGLITELVGFSRELTEDWLGQELESRGRPEPSDFPLPDLALFALRRNRRVFDSDPTTTSGDPDPVCHGHGFAWP